MSDGSRSALSRRRWRWTTSEPCPPFRGGFAPLPRRSASIFVLFSASATAEAGSAYLLGRGRLVRRRRGRRCPDLRAALPGDPAHAAGQRAVFLDQDPGAAGRTLPDCAHAARRGLHGVQIGVRPGRFGGAVSLGASVSTLHRRCGWRAVAGGLGGLSGGAAAVRTGGRRGRGPAVGTRA